LATKVWPFGWRIYSLRKPITSNNSNVWDVSRPNAHV
jgi:hypothetical protein